MRIVLGVLEPDAGAVRWHGPAARRARPRGASATCRRSAGCTRRCASPTSSCYLARLHGVDGGRGRARAADALARAARARRARRRPRRDALARQPAARAARAPRSCTTPSCSCSTSRSPASTRSASTCSARCCASARARGRAGRLLQPPARARRAPLRRRSRSSSDGRLVASGRVDELRARRGARRWRVAVDGRAAGLGRGRARACVVARTSTPARSSSSWTRAPTSRRCSTPRARAGRVRRFAPERADARRALPRGRSA